jgi:hypothetical protein
MKEQKQIHGILWHPDEASYFRFRDACTDKDNFYPTFSEWVSVMKHLEEELARGGQSFTKVNPDVEEFLTWCRIESRNPDGSARSVFAGQKAAEILGYGNAEL